MENTSITDKVFSVM